MNEPRQRRRSKNASAPVGQSAAAVPAAGRPSARGALSRFAARAFPPWRPSTHYRTFRRYPLLPTPWLTVCLHVYTGRARLPFHDHPWGNVSVRLWGRWWDRQIERFAALDRGPVVDVSHRRVIVRRATTAHETQWRGERRLVTLFVHGRPWNVIGGMA